MLLKIKYILHPKKGSVRNSIQNNNIKHNKDLLLLHNIKSISVEIVALDVG